jgi:murein DD-endopeptidase MepM/ murein hydrolase activator NlpD
MVGAGMSSEGKTWRGTTLQGNLGKRIAIGQATDPGLSSYLFVAMNYNVIMDEIQSTVTNNPSMRRAEMRESLKAEATGGATNASAGRYQALRNSMIDFYLGSGTVDARYYQPSQFFGIPTAETADLYDYHVGIDIPNPNGTPLMAPWTGLVEQSVWSDEVGNTVSVIAGYKFEDQFMSAGFSYGNAHMSRRDVSSGWVALNRILGLSGHTGTMVVGNPGDHNHFTIYNLNYGRNRYLSDVLGLGDSSSFRNPNGRAWQWPYNNSRRFYDPADAYAEWFRW